jgi:hypothetical protein
VPLVSRAISSSPIKGTDSEQLTVKYMPIAGA